MVARTAGIDMNEEIRSLSAYVLTLHTKYYGNVNTDYSVLINIF